MPRIRRRLYDFLYRSFPNKRPGRLRAVAPKNQAAPVVGAGHGGSEAGPETWPVF